MPSPNELKGKVLLRVTDLFFEETMLGDVHSGSESIVVDDGIEVISQRSTRRG